MKIGILGGGQLARMLTLAGYPLGIETVCIDPQPEACAKKVTSVIHSPFAVSDAAIAFGEAVDYITYETENIPLSFAQLFTQKLAPGLDSLCFSQDRLLEKQLFQELNIPTPKFANIESLQDLQAYLPQFNNVGILKTRTNGYDGKGQIRFQAETNVADAWHSLQHQALILEEWISFDFEVSLIAVRNRAGECLFYPLVLNKHNDGILHLSKAPFQHAKLQLLAESYAQGILEKLNHIGIMTIEFFVKEASLIANEMAPRVHNSGHWTIEGAQTSQFENHLRAICDLPLGSTEAIGYSAMVNAIGENMNLQAALNIPHLHYHTYGKAARPGRKLGHATICADNMITLENSLQHFLKQYKIDL